MKFNNSISLFVLQMWAEIDLLHINLNITRKSLGPFQSYPC